VISDPGARLVAQAHAHGIRVEPVPGPSAITAVLAATAIGGEGFLFAGFPPARSKARIRWFEALRLEARPLVLFEAPHRIHETLRDIAAVLGNRMVAVGRELTKTHEELGVRPINAWLELLPVERGEFTVVISGAPEAAKGERLHFSEHSVASEFGYLTNKRGLARRQAIKLLAGRYGISSREVFDLLERHKKSGK
jgi:16S rRNA (cytidine1402-2'-O)-methyltransferase